jgi:hypothetical protein
MKTFTRGLAVCMLRAMPVNAGTFLAFDTGKNKEIIISS